jgi:hypothetical protein
MITIHPPQSPMQCLHSNVMTATAYVSRPSLPALSPDLAALASVWKVMSAMAGTGCADIDECQLSSTCAATEDCSNMIGGFVCRSRYALYAPAVDSRAVFRLDPNTFEILETIRPVASGGRTPRQFCDSRGSNDWAWLRHYWGGRCRRWRTRQSGTGSILACRQHIHCRRADG